MTDAPDYGPFDQWPMVVRRFNSGMTHVPISPDAAAKCAVATTWIGPSYWALHEPWKAICGTTLVNDHRGTVIMKPGTKVKCRFCRRLLS